MRRFPTAATSMLSALVMVLALLAPLGGSDATADPNQAPAISPTPQSVTVVGGRFRVPAKVTLVSGAHSDPAAVRDTVSVLSAAGAREIVRVGEDEEAPAARLTVHVGGPEDNRTALGHGLSGLPPGGYVLASTGHAGRWTLVLAGTDSTGQFYAAQTLRQIVQPNPGPDSLPGLVVRDWPTLPTRGVIEGFYGTPWSTTDRLRLLDYHGRSKLNTYVYAPKDDPFHRNRWREPYPADRLDEFRALAARAADRHVDFVFAISPGADICYSGATDFQLLTAKAQTLRDAGVRSFALFFDDIAGQLGCAEDVAAFGADLAPAAAAQAHLLNRFATEFLATRPGSGPLLTVPTEYNGAQLSPYKRRFAELVSPDVRVMWTGPQVISPTIGDEDIADAHRVFQHPLVLWDNYPVNDAQPDRLYLGPLTGRGIRPADNGSTGLLANPMVQAEPSKLVLSTVADYAWNPAAYDPLRAERHALRTLGGPRADALAAFVDVNRSSPLDPTPAPALSADVARFDAALADGRPGTAAEPLVRRFTLLAGAKAAISSLTGDLDGAAFVAGADPWLRKTAVYGAGGAAVVRSLTAEHAGDFTTAWRERTVFERAVAAAADFQQTVAPGVIDPFLVRAGAASRLVTLDSPAPGTPITPGSDVTLTASVRSGTTPITSVRFLVGDTVVGTDTAAPYEVVWHDVPRRFARTVVEATDATGAIVRSAPVEVVIGTPDRALLVYGGDGNPGTGGLAPGEVDVRDRLEHLGLAVDPVPAVLTSAGDAVGKALVVVSSTVASGNVADKFRDAAVPVLVWEAFVFDDMAMATASGEEFRLRTAHFTAPPTPLSAGLSGTVEIYRQEGRVRWAVPAPTAIVAATMPDDPTRATLFGYERGAALVGGLPAPARRVGMYLGDEGLLSGLVSEATVRVFDTAVRWSLGAA
ncbi:MAG: beta-N-acetylglucosaminidase domain-containing protein [Actinomycetota bacterium]|nr:beta-N-acetylglucosaminidase domain-containing protein [Actinomycetota bacterium]